MVLEFPVKPVSDDVVAGGAVGAFYGNVLDAFFELLEFPFEDNEGMFVPRFDHVLCTLLLQVHAAETLDDDGLFGVKTSFVHIGTGRGSSSETVFAPQKADFFTHIALDFGCVQVLPF